MINTPDNIVTLYIIIALLAIVILILFALSRKKRKPRKTIKKAAPSTETITDKNTPPCEKKRPEAEQPKKAVTVQPAAAAISSKINEGVDFLKAGDLGPAERCLQSVLDEAVKSEDTLLQREARYYLAKVNKEMGDLTLACEHWQIARDLYQGSDEDEKLSEIEEDMRQNGCPTDWVLNGF